MADKFDGLRLIICRRPLFHSKGADCSESESLGRSPSEFGQVSATTRKLWSDGTGENGSPDGGSSKSDTLRASNLAKTSAFFSSHGSLESHYENHLPAMA